MWKNVVKVQSEPFVNINYSLSINFNVYFIDLTLFYLVKLPNYFEITSTQTPLELICRTDKHASYKSHQHGSDSRWDLTPIIWVIITFNCYSIRKSRNYKRGNERRFCCLQINQFPQLEAAPRKQRSNGERSSEQCSEVISHWIFNILSVAVFVLVCGADAALSFTRM